MLMDAGASANSFSAWFGPGDKKLPNPVLYHAWCNAGNDESYCAIVDLLIDAGGDRETATNTSGVPPERMASARVAQHLSDRLAKTTNEA